MVFRISLLRLATITPSMTKPVPELLVKFQLIIPLKLGIYVKSKMATSTNILLQLRNGALAYYGGLIGICL